MTKEKTRPRLRRRDVKFDVSVFCGPLLDRKTRQPVMCDLCSSERATWAHVTKKGGHAYLCFGCGGH